MTIPEGAPGWSADPDQPIPFTLTARGRAAVLSAPIVCLCGSTRAGIAVWRRVNLERTLAGEIVLTIGVNIKDPADVAAAQALGYDIDQAKTGLDELHKRKIDLADYVLVLNVGGYIGDSTRSEIAYATAHGKPVTYLEPAGMCPCGDPGQGWQQRGWCCRPCAVLAHLEWCREHHGQAGPAIPPPEEWACRGCGDAFFGTAPQDGLCLPCRNSPSAGAR